MNFGIINRRSGELWAPASATTRLTICRAFREALSPEAAPQNANQPLISNSGIFPSKKNSETPKSKRPRLDVSKPRLSARNSLKPKLEP